MNSYDPELYGELKRLGINTGILGLLPEPPLKLKRVETEIYIWEAAGGDYAFWIHHGHEASLAIQNQILKNLELNGFPGFLYPIALKDGRTYARLDERRWFYVTPMPELRRLFFSDHRDIRAMVRLIADFRMAMKISGPLSCLPDRKENNNLINKFYGVIGSFNSFNLLAKYRLKPSKFDHLFTDYVSEAMIQMKCAVSHLERSKYRILSDKLTTQDLIINRLVRSNLRMARRNHAVCLKFNDFRWDLPIIDLAILMIKTGRASQWSKNWFETILSEYRRQCEITPEEREIIYAYLMFPWSFYRLSSRYYYNRVEWSLGTLVSRMERILEDDGYRKKFLSDFHKNF